MSKNKLYYIKLYANYLSIKQSLLKTLSVGEKKL